MSPTALLERVGAGSPPGEEEGQANSLKDLGDGSGNDSVEGTLLSESLRDELETDR